MKNEKRKPRIGIITFHRAINYGALLQTYALQEAVSKLGCICNIIDYRNPRLERLHKESKLSDCRNLKDLGRFIVYSRYQNEKFKKFRDFSSKYLELTRPYKSIDELKIDASEYDSFICGSDQVWNYKITDFDKSYFLDFCDDESKKNSYAASFGLSSIPLEYTAQYGFLLKKFNHISVREAQGKTIIQNFTSRDVQVVLDPTMLIDKEEWAMLSSNYNKIKNYILIYAFGHLTPTMKQFVEKLSRQTACAIVIISYALKKPIKAMYEKTTGPAEFLGLFQNARYVVTNSFHGTAFAINFNKDFFLEMLPESHGVNSRLENILDVFDLRERQIVYGENASIGVPINYRQVNQTLSSERKKSLEYLNNIIKKLPNE